ncbi:peptidase C14, caspase domain-containing protein [Suillus plorans]|uniref:Peptidase C14, caspase domain-containing protein n=1 Tax=Suillus plorans TaxID=116603 RepID=A0A9P7AP95_9AGAM|nr:peptidase C14, caspase domain-containing protein [Suillus plorans]KAG1793338.1 peptidase C14, caspase domain-containing protein [Suillus plorans]
MSEASFYIPMYTQPSPPSPGRKRASLIGINYKGQRCELRGCNNDIHNILPCLINQWGYDPRDIVQLIDDGYRPPPTRQNILLEMHRLASYSRAGDSMFFYFSGHGGQVRDLDGDEVDGYDEFVCPVDYQESGVINDDEIHEIMSLIERTQVKPLAAGSRLTVRRVIDDAKSLNNSALQALFDSCHSGTVLDLPYLYDSRQCTFVNGVTPGARIRKHSQAQVVCFSGCEDFEESESIAMPGRPIGGLMTFVRNTTKTSVPSNLPLKAFVHVFSCTQALTFQNRFEQIRAFVREILPDARQHPQFSCSNPLDITLPFYI